MEIIRFLYEFIRTDIVIGFGLYSVLFFVIRRFSDQKLLLNEFDHTAVRLVVMAGIVFAALWILGNSLDYLSLKNELDKHANNERMFGKYWFGFWFQPLFWIALTQLLRVDVLKKSLAFRIVLSALFMFSFERIIIIITAMHRDYFPEYWMPNISLGEILLNLILKTVIFIGLTGVVHFGIRRFKAV